MKRLAIITTHPIQYNAPLFAMLSKRRTIEIKIFYTWGSAVKENKYDPGFGEVIEWDLPLLEDYEQCFVENTAKDPGSHQFKGIVNPSLIKDIESWKADVILVFGWAFHSHLKCLRYFHGKMPVLFRGDSTLLDEHKGIKQFLRRLFLTWMYFHVDFALFVGKNNKQYFIAHGLKAAQLVHAPHATDNERFAEPNDLYEREALFIRQTLGVTETDLLLLFAGKFEAKKNPLYLLKLLTAIPDRRLKILFVGSGVLLPKIKAASEKDPRILLMDFQNQQRMPIIYRIADLFILPSSGPGETWGLALNEAMASGRAIAATNKVGGSADLIDPAINGLVIDPTNDKDFITFIELALDDKTPLKEMGRQSRKKIQSFTFNCIAQVIEETVLRVG